MPTMRDLGRTSVLLYATVRLLGSILVPVQISLITIYWDLTGSSEARHQQAAWWLLISFSTGGCYYGNTTRSPHEEMSVRNGLSCLAFLQELNKIVRVLCVVAIVQLQVCLS